jgi:RNA polymerase sigma factor (sigma-70 family)
MGRAPLEDRELAFLIAHGDEEAEGQLVLRFRRAILLRLRRRVPDASLAEDLCQETLRAGLEGLRAGRLRDPLRVCAYLRGIAANLVRRDCRRRRRAGHPGPDPNDVADGAPSAEEHLLAEEERRRVRVAPRGLRERDRALLSDLFLRDLGKPSICERWDLSPAQFDLVKHRAIRRLGRVLAAGDGEAA